MEKRYPRLSSEEIEIKEMEKRFPPLSSVIYFFFHSIDAHIYFYAKIVNIIGNG